LEAKREPKIKEKEKNEMGKKYVKKGRKPNKSEK